MHLLESYALNCGAKIDKPYIYETFFPLPIEKFITFNMDNEPSKNYDYWQDVINIINPVLANNDIKIIQIGEGAGPELGECISLRGQMSPNQLAYIVKRSMLHAGPDGFLLQLAGSFDVPVVGLFSSTYAGCTKPYFGSLSKQRFFSSHEYSNQKPSFSSEETPKNINLICPEKIASAIFELLGIQFEIPFETIFTGKKYSHLIIEESIPNDSKILFNPEHQIEIRADIAYDEQSFANQLVNYKKAVVVMDKPINMNILRQLKNNIATLIFKITDENQRELLANLVGLGRQIILISTLPKERIQELKPLYYAFGNINKIEEIPEDKLSELKKDIENLYYRSAKVTAAGGKYYYSYAAFENNMPMSNHHEYQKVIDSPAFWENLNTFTIVRKKNLTSPEVPVTV